MKFLKFKEMFLEYFFPRLPAQPRLGIKKIYKKLKVVKIQLLRFEGVSSKYFSTRLLAQPSIYFKNKIKYGAPMVYTLAVR